MSSVSTNSASILPIEESNLAVAVINDSSAINFIADVNSSLGVLTQGTEKPKSKRQLAVDRKNATAVAKAETKELSRLAQIAENKKQFDAAVLRVIAESGFVQGKPKKTKLPKGNRVVKKRKFSKVDTLLSTIQEGDEGNEDGAEDGGDEENRWNNEDFDPEGDLMLNSLDSEEEERRCLREAEELQRVDANHHCRAALLSSIIKKRYEGDNDSNQLLTGSGLWPLASELEDVLRSPASPHVTKQKSVSSALLETTVGKVMDRSSFAIYKDLDIGPAVDLKCGCIFIVLPENTDRNKNIVDFYQIENDPFVVTSTRSGKRLITSRDKH